MNIIMGKCSIVYCKNRNDNKSQKKVRTFYFPKNEEIRNKWLEICQKDGTKLNKSAFVCEDHFVETDYKPKPEYLKNCPNFSYSPRRRRIKDDAVPSINLVADNERMNSATEENVPASMQSFQGEIPQDTRECVNFLEVKSEAGVNFDHSQVIEHDGLFTKECENNLKRESASEENVSASTQSFQGEIPRDTRECVYLLKVKSEAGVNFDHSQVIEHDELFTKECENNLKRESATEENVPASMQSFQGEIPRDTRECVNFLEVKSEAGVDFDHSQVIEHDELLTKECTENLKRESSDVLEKLTDLEELKNKIRKVEKETERMKNKYNRLHNKHTKVMKKYNEIGNENEKVLQRRRDIRNHLRNLKFENINLKKDISNLQKSVKKYEKMEAAVRNVLTDKQIHRMMHPELKYVHWDTETIARAMSICSSSGSAYNYLRSTNYPLPSRSCIRKWGSLMKIQEGILHNVVYMMESKGHLLEKHKKLVILSFDEVCLDERMDICKKREQVTEPRKTAQVCFARGLFMSWKQPIFYKFDETLTKEILDDIIKELYRIGYTVVAVVTDLGETNAKVFKQCNIGIKKKQNCYFIHPCDEKLKIFVFADVPRLFKLFRNHLLDYGYEIEGQLENDQVATKCVNKTIVEELLSIEQDDELKFAFKLTKEQSDAREAKTKNVSKATKIISNSNARATRWYGNENLLDYEDWRLTADVFELMNSWFDMFNSEPPYGYSLGQEGYRQNLAEQDQILSRVTDLIYSLKFGEQEVLRPFQRDIILNNTSLKDLLPYLQKTYDNKNFKITYILTNRLNQDVLKHFFAIIRAMGRTHDHTPALEFEHRLKSYILGKHVEVILSRCKNAEDDHEKCPVSSNEDRKKIVARAKMSMSNDDKIPLLVHDNDLPTTEDDADV